MVRADRIKNPEERTKAHIDSARTGLATGAGAGAAVSVMVAFRPHPHTEQVAGSTGPDGYTVHDGVYIVRVVAVTTPATWLVDKSALRPHVRAFADVLIPRVAAGRVVVCLVTELEVGYSARSTKDFERTRENVIDPLLPVGMPYRAEDRALGRSRLSLLPVVNIERWRSLACWWLRLRTLRDDGVAL